MGGPQQPPSESADPSRDSAETPRFRSWMGAMWLYTLLRFGLFFALWGILYLIGLKALVAAAVGLVLSVPLSFVLLARPRARMAAQIDARLAAHRQSRAEFDGRLDPGNDGS
jgi:O-antigen ligase